MFNQEDTPGWGTILAVIGGVITLMIVVTIAGYWIDRTYFYPQIRQNTVANPATPQNRARRTQRCLLRRKGHSPRT